MTHLNFMNPSHDNPDFGKMQEWMNKEEEGGGGVPFGYNGNGLFAWLQQYWKNGPDNYNSFLIPSTITLSQIQLVVSFEHHSLAVYNPKVKHRKMG